MKPRLSSACLVALLAACEPAPPEPVQYVDVTAASGIDFRHVHGGSGEKYFVETNGSGAAFFDYDDDGDQDLYVVQAGALPGFTEPGPFQNRLYRNEGGLHFTDVTAEAGVGDEGYGMGAVAADYDGDGRRDLYVYNWGPDVLYRNRGDGTFEDVTRAAGIDSSEYSGTALFADFDRDGDLDLFVGHYVEFSIAAHRPCARPPAERSYCHPDTYAAQADHLYRNEGDGTFQRCDAAAGITRQDGKALGCLALDYDMDGDLDLAVANDSSPNHLYRNDGGPGELRFTDVSEITGFAYDRDGRTQGSMGITAADIDGDLRLDLFVTNFTAESNALYVGRDNATFEDEIQRRGMGPQSYMDFGWGTSFVDYDKDTDPDLLVINGHLHDQVQIYEGSQEHAQSPRLFENDGQGRFTEVSAAAGPFFAQKLVGRGLAMADLDDDGDLDFFVNMNDRKAILVECRGGPLHPWVGVKLVGKPPNRDAIGATVWVHLPARVQMQEVRTGGSFASQSDPRLVFGLGQARWPERVSVRWPDGTVESYGRPAPGEYHTLIQGEGTLLKKH